MALTNAELRRAEMRELLGKLAPKPDAGVSDPCQIDAWQEPNGRYAASASWPVSATGWSRVVVTGMATRALAEGAVLSALRELTGVQAAQGGSKG